MPPAEISPFFAAHATALRAAAELGPVLDLACGRGRHALAAAAAGARVVALDRSIPFLEELRRDAAARSLPVACVRADLEGGAQIPFASARLGAVLVFRYLWRPLSEPLADLLRAGGLLLYETFTIHQRDLPHGPGNAAFLLDDGELPKLFPELEVVDFREEAREDADGRRWHLASLAARRPAR